jgi:electron transport complex protein RnfG
VPWRRQIRLTEEIMKDIFRLCFVLTLITAVSAGVLAFVSDKTEEPISNALREAKMKAVRQVLPPYDNDLMEDRVFISGDEGDSVEVFVGMEGSEITGVAFPVVAHRGYSGDINFLVGVNSDGVIQGIQILNHAETPGLGAKIQGEEFRAQYRGCSIDSPKVWKVKQDGGVFEPITGATISSRAVTEATLKGLEFFRNNFDSISRRTPGTGSDQKGEGANE